LFHNTYESLAPDFGYETREDTKAFDPKSANGKLMVAVCERILSAISLAPVTPQQAAIDALEEAAAIADEGVAEANRKMAKWAIGLNGRPSVRYRIARADKDARMSVRDRILAIKAIKEGKQ